MGEPAASPASASSPPAPAAAEGSGAAAREAEEEEGPRLLAALRAAAQGSGAQGAPLGRKGEKALRRLRALCAGAAGGDGSLRDREFLESLVERHLRFLVELPVAAGARGDVERVITSAVQSASPREVFLFLAEELAHQGTQAGNPQSAPSCLEGMGRLLLAMSLVVQNMIERQDLKKKVILLFVGDLLDELPRVAAVLVHRHTELFGESEAYLRMRGKMDQVLDSSESVYQTRHREESLQKDSSDPFMYCLDCVIKTLRALFTALTAKMGRHDYAPFERLCGVGLQVMHRASESFPPVRVSEEATWSHDLVALILNLAKYLKPRSTQYCTYFLDIDTVLLGNLFTFVWTYETEAMARANAPAPEGAEEDDLDRKAVAKGDVGRKGEMMIGFGLLFHLLVFSYWTANEGYLEVISEPFDLMEMTEKAYNVLLPGHTMRGLELVSLVCIRVKGMGGLQNPTFDLNMVERRLGRRTASAGAGPPAIAHGYISGGPDQRLLEELTVVMTVHPEQTMRSEAVKCFNRVLDTMHPVRKADVAMDIIEVSKREGEKLHSILQRGTAIKGLLLTTVKDAVALVLAKARNKEVVKDKSGNPFNLAKAMKFILEPLAEATADPAAWRSSGTPPPYLIQNLDFVIASVSGAYFLLRAAKVPQRTAEAVKRNHAALKALLDAECRAAGGSDGWRPELELTDVEENNLNMLEVGLSMLEEAI